MAFFRKAGNVLRRAASNHISQEISSTNPSIFQAIRCMSSSKLFIGGLSFNTDDRSLKEAFNEYGQVAEARVIVDRETGRSRGFGFVTYSSIDEATAAIQALNQQELHGRRIRVDYANDRVRGYGGGGGFGGSYGTAGGYGGSSNYNPREESYASGAGARGSANYAGYDGGNLSYGGDSQNFGIAGGGGGSEQTNYGAGADEGFREDDSVHRNYKDDDDSLNNCADKRSS